MSIPLLEPELLKAFVAVADSRSFTRAATQLNRTQSAVSMQIKRLEDRLGVELFNRTKANVDLSAAGEGLLGYARRILTLNDEAVGKLWERKIEGVVRLGVMDDYGTLIVPPVLASFAACYPLVHVEMEIGLTSSMPSRSDKGRSFGGNVPAFTTVTASPCAATASTAARLWLTKANRHGRLTASSASIAHFRNRQPCG